LGVITVGGSLYFGAAHHVEEAIRTSLEKGLGQRFLLLRLQLADHCDVSGIHMLEALVRYCRQGKGDVFVTGVRPLVRAQMALIGFDRFLGEDHFLDREEAISHLFHKVLDPSVCIYECDVRVFAECQALPKHNYGEHLADRARMPEHGLQQWLPSELKAQLERDGSAPGLVLVDVREPREYEGGHIPQARLLPLRLIAKQGRSLPSDRQIVLVCRSGRRSRLATYILQDMGYTHVCNLQGGMLAWEAAGYPVAVE
jgi:SulP family sulfate permease